MLLSRCSHSVSLSLGSVRSFWSHLKKAPLDGNHATNHAFEVDKSPLKVNLGRGVYKDDNGKDWVLPCVRAAEERIASAKHGHEYLKFDGLPEFCKLTREFAFGKSVALDKVATTQTISGTGALRVGAEFLARSLLKDGKLPAVYLPDPTYVNHSPVFANAGLSTQVPYRYFDYKTKGLDFNGMMEDLDKAPSGSILLLHSCAHNPTGVDPTVEQWKQLSKLAKKRNLICFFDTAYQGFATGDPEHDAQAFRIFIEQDQHTPLVAQSYAKNFGLYGQRTGALNIVAKTPEEAAVVSSNLNSVIRPMYSNPPAYGARIVATVFADPALKAQWFTDVKTMADRIKGARQALVDNLAKAGSKKNWSHITNQIGMFAYSGLTEKQVLRLRDLHCYCNLDGRMSITGINTKNVEYLAKSMHEATKDD